MPTEDDEDKDRVVPAVSLSRDGKIEGLYLPKDQRRPVEAWENPPQLPPLDLEPLELAPREPKPEPPPEPEAYRPGSGRAIAIGAGVLLLCAGVLFLVLRHPARQAAETSPVAEKLAVPETPEGAPALSVESEPSGATVFVQGEESGNTPLLGSNEFSRGSQVQVRLELKGYQPWTGTFNGGVNAKVRATLRRR
jgi:eukaryotic-like serine/threonine-protein kinase